MTIIEDKIATFIADAGAIAVSYLCSRKSKVVDCDVAVGNDDCLAVRNQAGRYHLDHPVDGLECDVFVDRNVVVHISASLHLNYVAILRSSNCGCNRRKIPSRTD